MNGLADEQDLRLRFDVLTRTKQPELCRCWTTRDRAANVRQFQLAAEVLQTVEAGVFRPNPGWIVSSGASAGHGGRRSGKAMHAMMPVIPRSASREVTGYVKAVRALDAVGQKREARSERVVRPLDRKRDVLTVEVATRLRALSGGQHAAAQRLLAMITQAMASDGVADRG